MSSNGSGEMNREEIEARIPHRQPMLLVDEVHERTDDRIVATYTFHDSEFFFQGHYPDYPLVPGVILCEACMQAGALLLSFQSDGEGVPVATRINDVRFKKMVRPGDTLHMEVETEERVANAFFMRAKATCNGKLAVRFSFACALVAET